MGSDDAIEPDAVPTPERPWSHGRLPTGRPLYISGQTPVDADGNVVHPGDLGAQFKQALHNVDRVVTAAGGTTADLTKLTIYVTDIATWRAHDIGQRRYDYLEKPYPCSTLVEVSGLAQPEYLVEIEGVAHLDEPVINA